MKHPNLCRGRVARSWGLLPAVAIVAVAVAVITSGVAIPVAAASSGSSGDFVGLAPGRVLDTRSGPGTVDRKFAGIGTRQAGEVFALPVAGRAGVAVDAVAVALNVTVTAAQGPGFVTVYPCGAERPNASNVNYVRGATIANAVVSQIAGDGTVCLFTYAATELVVDVNGYFPTGSRFGRMSPARILDTRPGYSTIDGQFAMPVSRGAGSVLELPVAGRAGVPTDAGAVMLNVTVTEAAGPGFVTVYPCDSERPTASNLNYVAGQTIANAVSSKVSRNGTVCLYTYAATALVVDINGFYPGGVAFAGLTPARLADTRSDPFAMTIDGQFSAGGARPAGSVLELPVTGRGGVDPTAVAVALNITVTEAQAPGFVTVYPCDSARPNASNLNFTIGQTIADAALIRLSATGSVCLYTYAATHLIVDVTGIFPATTGPTRQALPWRFADIATLLNAYNVPFDSVIGPLAASPDGTIGVGFQIDSVVPGGIMVKLLAIYMPPTTTVTGWVATSSPYFVADAAADFGPLVVTADGRVQWIIPGTSSWTGWDPVSAPAPTTPVGPCGLPASGYYIAVPDPTGGYCRLADGARIGTSTSEFSANGGFWLDHDPAGTWTLHGTTNPYSFTAPTDWGDPSGLADDGTLLFGCSTLRRPDGTITDPRTAFKATFPGFIANDCTLAPNGLGIYAVGNLAQLSPFAVMADLGTNTSTNSYVSRWYPCPVLMAGLATWAIDADCTT